MTTSPTAIGWEYPSQASGIGDCLKAQVRTPIALYSEVINCFA